MKIKNCMRTDAVVLRPDDGISAAARLFMSERIGAAPVVDSGKRIVGIVSIMDILNTFIPDFVSLLKDIDFIKDYGALDLHIKRLKDVEALKVSDIMTKNVVTITEDSDLMTAIALMKKHGFRDLPVLRDGKLVGMVSHLDLCRRFLEVWDGKTRGED